MWTPKRTESDHHFPWSQQASKGRWADVAAVRTGPLKLKIVRKAPESSAADDVHDSGVEVDDVSEAEAISPAALACCQSSLKSAVAELRPRALEEKKLPLPRGTVLVAPSRRFETPRPGGGSHFGVSGKPKFVCQDASAEIPNSSVSSRGPGTFRATLDSSGPGQGATSQNKSSKDAVRVSSKPPEVKLNENVSGVVRNPSNVSRNCEANTCSSCPQKNNSTCSGVPESTEPLNRHSHQPTSLKHSDIDDDVTFLTESPVPTPRVPNDGNPEISTNHEPEAADDDIMFVAEKPLSHETLMSLRSSTSHRVAGDSPGRPLHVQLRKVTRLDVESAVFRHVGVSIAPRNCYELAISNCKQKVVDVVMQFNGEPEQANLRTSVPKRKRIV